MTDLAISLLLDMFSIYLVDEHAVIGIKIFLLSALPALILGLLITWKYKNLSLREFHSMGTSHPIHANLYLFVFMILAAYRDWETDRKSTRLNSSHRL